MRADLFDYDLPDELIAQHPPAARDGARLLTVRAQGVEHGWIREWVELVEPGSVVVLNQTRVIPARLRGYRVPGGGRVELFLLNQVASPPNTEGVQIWEALGRANRPLRPGCELRVGDLRATVLAKGEKGHLQVELRAERSIEAVIEQYGEVPIPPYLKRDPCPEDTSRYQTVFARDAGSVAAPTAGLHLTAAALARLGARGVKVEFVTLHVGAGTFLPIVAPTLDEHVMHQERFVVGREVARAIEETRARGKAVVAVGTTVVRALESAADVEREGQVREMAGETRLMLKPGSPIRVVDALLTNFHQPRSTLLALVSALAGRERVLAAYEAAKAANYRFLSYGDAMWIPNKLGREESP